MLLVNLKLNGATNRLKQSCCVRFRNSNLGGLGGGRNKEEQAWLGNPLWLIGAYAPVGLKSFFKISKNSE
jgi:hypothetical protein